MNYMAASDCAGGFMGLKIYTVSPTGVRFVVSLFSARSGEMCALIEADYLGQMRTGGQWCGDARAGAKRCRTGGNCRDRTAGAHAIASGGACQKTRVDTCLWP